MKDARSEHLFFPPIQKFEPLRLSGFEPPDARLEKALFDYVYDLGTLHPVLFEWIHAYTFEDRFQTTPSLKGMELLMDSGLHAPCFQVSAVEMPKLVVSLRRLGFNYWGSLNLLIHYENGHCNLAFLRFQGSHLEVCHLESGPLIESSRCASDNCEALSEWGGTSTHYVFEKARLKSAYGCRSLMVLDFALFDQAAMWNQIDWMKLRRPWWFKDVNCLYDQGESLYPDTKVIRYMPPHFMMTMESVRQLESYMEDVEVRAFWGDALIDQMKLSLEPFLKTRSFDLKEKRVNTLLKIQHLLQIKRLVKWILPHAPTPSWRS